MYTGRPFTREQVIFMVETALSAALNRIEVMVPPSTPIEEFKANIEERRHWAHGCEETAGRMLATIYAQLTGKRLTIAGALESIGFDYSVTTCLASAVIKDGLTGNDFRAFPVRRLAVRFVDGSVKFQKYFAKTNKRNSRKKIH